MRPTFIRHFALLLLLLFSAQAGRAQGITTAAMNGVITDKTGAGLPGATVVAVHTPTGTQYGVATNSDGRFNIQNMRVGGPYTVRITFVGYQDVVRDDIMLTLGQNLRLDVNLSEATTQLNEVVVSGQQNPIINSDRTGASTTIQRQQLERLPTLNRSFSDFTRLTPQSSGQGFAGRNSGYNNVTIDGAIFNNSFGLNSTVGGQANAQPISLDAIEQIQVSIAPYDVRQGSFTGAGINAVTRSGTNKFSGSAYEYHRDQNLIGQKSGDVQNKFQKFTLNNYGFRVGGPIIKDKLFFFLNGEEERRSDPGTTYNATVDGQAATNTTSQVRAADLDILSNFLQTQYGYNPGAYQGYSLRQNSRKATAKLDWNISNQHRLSVKYNYLKSYRDVNPSSSGAIANNRAPSIFGLPFFSSYYTINNNLNSFIAELNSTFGNKYANNFTAGYSAFRDSRSSPGGGNFPLVDIGNATGLSAAGARTTAQAAITSFGYEPFTANNVLNSDVYQFGDNFTAYLGKHNVTLGTYNEFYKFTNGFAPNYYGAYQFNSLDDFYASAGYQRDASGNPVPRPATAAPAYPQRYQLQYSALPDGSFPFAVIKSAQLGLYVQDEWTPVSNLKLTVGLRGDMPFITSDLLQNTQAAGLAFRDGTQINTSRVPKKVVLFSPRVGFNLDVFDDKKTQLRGGTGIFTGRVPFVWISNQASNNGVLFGSFDRNNSNATTATTVGFPFSPDVNQYRPQNAAANTSYNLAVTAPDFKFPQVWRSNLAVDQLLPGGVVTTLEAIYTKDINAVYHANLNLPQSVRNATGVTGRPEVYAGDNRPIFYSLGAVDAATGLAKLTANNRIYNGQNGNPVITDAIEMRNTSKGYSYYLTGQLHKSFANGLYGSISYTYADSRSVNDGGSIAQSIWRDRQVSGDPNADVLGYSQFFQQHRVLVAASYRHEYIGHLGTTLSAYYDASPLGRYSYVYSGDMNGDGQTSNDLMYIPRTQDEIILRDIAIPAAQGGGTYSAAQQWTDLNSFIDQDKYLSKNRGAYAERNGAVLPWFRELDVKLLQDIFTEIGPDRHTLQLSVDIFNVGNLLNKNWGAIKTPNRVNPLKFDGYDAQGRPNFEYPYFVNPAKNTDNTVTPGQPLRSSFRENNGALSSRWQMQVGIRYLFN